MTSAHSIKSSSDAAKKLFPPGMGVRSVKAADNDAVRQLFIECRTELIEPDAERSQRIQFKKLTDAALMSDLAKPSLHYSQNGRQMWVLESRERKIVAAVAVEIAASESQAVLKHLLVQAEILEGGHQIAPSGGGEWLAMRSSQLSASIHSCQD